MGPLRQHDTPGRACNLTKLVMRQAFSLSLGGFRRFCVRGPPRRALQWPLGVGRYPCMADIRRTDRDSDGGAAAAASSTEPRGIRISGAVARGAELRGDVMLPSRGETHGLTSSGVLIKGCAQRLAGAVGAGSRNFKGPHPAFPCPRPRRRPSSSAGAGQRRRELLHRQSASRSRLERATPIHPFMFVLYTPKPNAQRNANTIRLIRTLGYPSKRHLETLSTVLFPASAW